MRGLTLHDGMQFDAWAALGRRVTRLSSASAWWLGDWLLFGQRSFPRRYAAACDATSLDYQTLRNYASVAGRIDVSRRRDALSFQHHAEVAALEPAAQELWLSRAETGGWSRNELRRQLSAERRQTAAADARVSLRITVAADRERRWRQAADTAGLELVDWMASTADAAAAADAAGSADDTDDPLAPMTMADSLHLP